MKKLKSSILFILFGFFLFSAFQQKMNSAKGKSNQPNHFGFGRTATPAEIKAWDIDILPDGTGLPSGEGTVAEGKVIYSAKCSVCHGLTGREGPQNPLVGREPREGFPFAESKEIGRKKTIGNYWPYATTIYDYTYRSMPQNLPGSLTPNEVYALVAFLLYQNEIISEDAVMNAETLPKVVMPAIGHFVNENYK